MARKSPLYRLPINMDIFTRDLLKYSTKAEKASSYPEACLLVEALCQELTKTATFLRVENDRLQTNIVNSIIQSNKKH